METVLLYLSYFTSLCMEFYCKIVRNIDNTVEKQEIKLKIILQYFVLYFLFRCILSYFSYIQ